MRRMRNSRVRLVGWAKSLGLTAPAERVARWERRLRGVVRDAAERRRFARGFALEGWVLENAHQLWADGPRRLEGLVLEKVRRASNRR